MSTLGDLRETAAARGEAWFWASVFGTTASLLWRAMVADKRRMLGLALRAWLLSLALGAIVTIAGIFIFGLALGLTVNNGSGAIGWSPISLLPILIGSMAITQFFIGRWIARRTPGRELPACLAIAILQSGLGWAAPIVLALATRDTAWLVRALESSWFLFTDPFCFLGALSVRRRVRT